MDSPAKVSVPTMALTIRFMKSLLLHLFFYFVPLQQLDRMASEVGLTVDSADFARWMDERDPLREFRLRFAYPKLRHLSTVGK